VEQAVQACSQACNFSGLAPAGFHYLGRLRNSQKIVARMMIITTSIEGGMSNAIMPDKVREYA
jgi:hypothetical protein